MKFNVKIRKSGVPDQTRVIEAPSRFVVYDQIQKEGGMVIELQDIGEHFKIPAWLTVNIGTGIKRTEIIRTAKNLSAMLAAGLSLSRALSVIERQSDNKHLKTIVTEISESVKKGSSFHDTLVEYPKVFSGLFAAMIKAGE